MKKFTFKILDGFRSSVSQQPRVEQAIVETLRQDNFQVAKTFRHGFPFQPTAVAFDPIQRLLALGTKSGSLRLLGRPGVDSHMRHEFEGAVLQIQFLTNEGALVTATADDSLHLWNFRQKKPEVVHTLKFQRERITYIHLPLQSKWLYVGTDRGNIHVVNIETFQLSGYVINWNKAIDTCRKTHPGPVVHLSDNPGDSSKLLIGFECGQLVLWDLRTRAAEIRWQAAEALRSVAWHHEGKQFVCSHVDGSLTTWAARAASLKPVSVSSPHAKTNKEGKLEACKPIQKVEWKASRASGESYLIFSGGLPSDKAGRAPSITVIHGKTTTVLEMEHNVVDFITLCESPWVSDFQDPYAIVVLLQNDLVVIDLLTPGFPCFENPYPMDIHESPVTCCTYLADCPSDLIPAFYSVGSRTQKRSGFSEREWPVCGGEWSPTSCSYNEIIITGHADGSVKFWDASAGTLQVLYKLKTSKVFEKPRTRSGPEGMLSGSDDDPFAVQLISLCPESRKLAIAGASSHVVLFKFRKQEAVTETWRLEVPQSCELLEEGECSPEYEYPPRPGLVQRGESTDGEGRRGENGSILRVRTGPQKKAPGFQAYLVCLPLFQIGDTPSPITSLCINSSYGLMAYGTESGVVVIDIAQRSCVLNMVTPDLYGSADPYQRVPRSPKRLNESSSTSEDRCRSPSTDQVYAVSSAEESDGGLKTPIIGGETSPRPPVPTPEPDYVTAESPVDETSSLSSSLNSLTLLPAGASNSTADANSSEQPQRRPTSLWKSFSLKKLKGTFASQKEPTTSTTNTTGSNSKLESIASSPPTTPTEAVNCDENIIPRVPPTPTELPGSPTTSGGIEYLTEEAIEALENGELDLSLENTETDRQMDTLPLPPARTRRKTPTPTPTDDSEDIARLLSRPKDLPLFDSATSNSKDRKISLQQIPKRKKNDLRKVNPAVATASSSTLGGLMKKKFSGLGEPLSVGQLQCLHQLTCNRGVRGGSVAALLTGSMLLAVSPESPALPRAPAAAPTASSATASGGGGGGERAAASRVQRGGDAANAAGVADKLDSSFSRSRSSSMSSLENITSEAVQCLAFADSYTKKSDPTPCPTLWVGTSLGSVLTVMINSPNVNDARHPSQPVVLTPCGTIFRLKGCILTMSFLDCNGALIPYSFEAWRDENREPKDRNRTRANMSPTTSAGSSTSSAGAELCGDRQFVVLVSEKQARVVALPSQNCVYREQLADTAFVVKAEIISLKDSVCLVCYLSSGQLSAYSLPSLRSLVYVEFLPLADLSFQTSKQGIIDPMLSIWGQQMFVNEDTDQIARTFCFSNRGHGLYLCSPTEVQKFTVSSEFCQSLSEMVGELFLTKDMPEPPKESFFRGLFGGGSRPLDREELFGESSGRASKTIAKHIAGPSLEQLGQRANTASSEVSRAHQMMVERGERLGLLDERTERMKNEAESFSSSAHQLMLKYKDKKWYQL